MNKSELIAKQQLKIESQKKKINTYKAANKEVYGLLYSIGAPLNDNVLGFNKAQMAHVYKIAQALGIR